MIHKELLLQNSRAVYIHAENRWHLKSKKKHQKLGTPEPSKTLGISFSSTEGYSNELVCCINANIQAETGNLLCHVKSIRA